MSAQQVINLADRRTQEASAGRQVIAVVLDDGTVRSMTDGEPRPDGAEYAAGQVSGGGWTLWWQRRDWE